MRHETSAQPKDSGSDITARLSDDGHVAHAQRAQGDARDTATEE